MTMIAHSTQNSVLLFSSSYFLFCEFDIFHSRRPPSICLSLIRRSSLSIARYSNGSRAVVVVAVPMLCAMCTCICSGIVSFVNENSNVRSEKRIFFFMWTRYRANGFDGFPILFWIWCVLFWAFNAYAIRATARKNVRAQLSVGVLESRWKALIDRFAENNILLSLRMWNRTIVVGSWSTYMCDVHRTESQ